MKRLFSFLFLAFFFAAATIVWSQVDLAELKKQEDERRKNSKPSVLQVDDNSLVSMVSDQRPYNFSEMQPGEEAEAAPAAGENTAMEAAATNEQAQEVSPSNERAKLLDPEYWVEKMNQLQIKINTLEEAITKNQEELNRMNTSFLLTDLPLQQQNVKIEIEKLRQQIASDQQYLDQAKQDLADLPNQARKSGIAAGILRQRSS